MKTQQTKNAQERTEETEDHHEYKSLNSLFLTIGSSPTETIIPLCFLRDLLCNSSVLSMWFD
jgi:hypothetical protein